MLELLPEQFSWRDVQPVGRLDHDTTGMLLMSDDGPFIHAQSSPKRHIPKVYVATTAEPVTEALIQTLLSGVQLHDEPAPLAAQRCEQLSEFTADRAGTGQIPSSKKRMLAAAGNHCVVFDAHSDRSITLSRFRFGRRRVVLFGTRNIWRY